MFRWYQLSAVCYVYLSDFLHKNTTEFNIKEHDIRKRVRQSRWFCRSWTLQELIAPKEVSIFSREWTAIGSQQDPDWCQFLAEVTGVAFDVLTQRDSYETASVAQKKS